MLQGSKLKNLWEDMDIFLNMITRNMYTLICRPLYPLFHGRFTRANHACGLNKKKVYGLGGVQPVCREARI